MTLDLQTAAQQPETAHAPGPRIARRPGLGLKLLTVGLSVLASLGALELGVRWWRYRTLWGIPQPGGYPDDITYRHPRYHHRYRPHAQTTEGRVDFHATYTTNALGLRGSREYGPKPAGVRRLLMLGDSFTFGIGVNDGQTFSALLQEAMDVRGAPIEIINAGVGSYSPILHYLTLRDLYLDWAPDAVILWFDFTDIQDDYEYEPHLLYDAAGQATVCNPDYVHGHRDWVATVLTRSALVKYLHHKLGGTVQRIRMLGWWEYVRAKFRGEDTKLAAVHLRGGRRSRVDLVAYDRLLMVRGTASAEELDRYWKRTGGYILKIRDLLAQRGVPLILGLYPSGVQVGPDQWGQGRTYWMFEPGRTYDDPLPFEFIERFARAQDIPVINTYPSFKAMREETLFLPMDGHFNAAGHQVLAAHVLHDPILAQLLRRWRGGE